MKIVHKVNGKQNEYSKKEEKPRSLTVLNRIGLHYFRPDFLKEI